MITIHDLKGTYLNYYGPEKYSLKPSDFIGKKIEDFISKENADLLKNPLFSKAAAGDTVFIFEQSRQIYIYRQTENKIVNIVQINDSTLTK